MIEFYDTANSPVTTVESSIVPPVGSVVSIRKVLWNVVGVTYAVDYSDRPLAERRLVAAVRITKA